MTRALRQLCKALGNGTERRVHRTGYEKSGNKYHPGHWLDGIPIAHKKMQLPLIFTTTGIGSLYHSPKVKLQVQPVAIVIFRLRRESHRDERRQKFELSLVYQLLFRKRTLEQLFQHTVNVVELFTKPIILG